MRPRLVRPGAGAPAGKSSKRSAVPVMPTELGFRMPAEWAPHAATWLAWPHESSDWPGKFRAVPWVFAEIARHLQDGEQIRILVRTELERKRAEKCLARAGVNKQVTEFFPVETDRSWTRDFLPLFVVRSEHGRAREVATVKWRFNGWARYDNYEKDDRAGREIASQVALRSFRPEARISGKRQRVVLEGGAIDVDGDGTLLATEQCLLSGPYARNRELGREGTEQIFRNYLGVDKVLWLPEGIAGDDTSGHIDDFARFVAPGKIVLCEEKNASDPNHRVLAAARERLTFAQDAQGRRLEMIPLPMPSPLYFDNQRLPASYANFYAGNAAVLVPTFNDPMDRVALGTLSELFPDRRVIGIHSVDFVLGLGTIHCSTQQQPAIVNDDAEARGKARLRRARARRAA